MPPRYTQSRYQSRSKSREPARRRSVSAKSRYSYDHPGPYGKAGRLVGSAAGAAIGARAGPAGRAVGAALGETVGGLAHYPARWFGSGDYYADRQSGRMAPNRIKLGSDNGEGVLIVHSEYIKDIISSADGSFKLESFGLNPGDQRTFPWLSTLAQSSFSQYRFEQLIFEFRSSSGEALNSTNTALGTISAAVNFDYSDEVFSSRYEMENTEWARSAKPSETFAIPVEVKRSSTGLNGGLLYILNTPVPPTGVDPKTYFLGRLMISSVGMQGVNVNMGSLHVTYKVRLLKPLMSKPLSVAHMVFLNRSAADGTNRTGVAPIASNFNCDTIGVTFTPTTITFSRECLRTGMRFYLGLFYVGVFTIGLTPPTVTYTGFNASFAFMGLLGVPFSATENDQPVSAPVSDTTISIQVEITVSNTDFDPVITLPAGVVYPTSANFAMMMYQVNGVNKQNLGFKQIES